MQTFLTSTNPQPLRAAQETAMMLDKARLGKQRVECKQLLLGQYPNHPASKMWLGYEHALTAYAIIMCKVWVRRGGSDTLLPYFQNLRHSYVTPLVWPWWYSHPAMVRCHQSKLYYKGSTRWVTRYEEEVVGKSMAGLPPLPLPYIWPDVDDEGVFRISAAEAKRNADWEIPSSWSFDVSTRIVIPR